MVRFHIEEVEVFFPYDYIYPEQYEYMRHLKTTLDAKGHCVLEMPTGTGKTVTLMAFITSYQLAHPEVGKLIYCTRTVPEMEKALKELETVVTYQREEREKDNHATAFSVTDDQPSETARSRSMLGLGMASRRNLCIHPEIMQEANRDKIDEKCQALTAPWIRRKRLMDAMAAKSGGAVPATGPPDIENITDDSALCAGHRTNSNTSATVENSCSSFCPYYENFENVWSPALQPSGVYTIDTMKIFGSEWAHPASPSVPTPFCPYFASRKLIHLANVVVLNYQYLLDPKVSQVAFMGGPGGFASSLASASGSLTKSGEGRDPSIVVFDEAHNIDNVCIEAFSINLNMMALEKARQNMDILEREISRAKSLNCSNLLSEYERLVKNLRDQGELDDIAMETLASPVLPQDVLKEAVPGTIRRAEFFLLVLKKLLGFLNVYIRVFSVKTEGPLSFLKHVRDETGIAGEPGNRHYEGKLLPYIKTFIRSLLSTLEVVNIDDFAPLILVADFFTLVGTYWEGFILITDPYPEAEGIYDPLIQLSCLDSSLAMKPVLERFQSVVLTSGTISPLFLYPKLLGFQPVITKSFPMSLERNCLCPLIVTKGSDQVPLSSRFDLRSDPAVLRNYGTLLVELAKSVPDGVVCFFTSYAFMETVVAEWYHMGVLVEIMQHKLILMETKDVVATTLALHSYRRACDSGRGAIFFSVARGKVAEGIDFDRHYGRAVVLVGVPYQYTLSRVLKARLDYLREHYDVPEGEFLTFDAMRQAAQCVGRVIRSKTDFGLMIFADCRYSRIDKRQKLPEWILRHLDPAHMALSTDAALSIARRFLLDMSQPLVMTSKSRLDSTSIKHLELKQQQQQETGPEAGEMSAGSTAELPSETSQPRFLPDTSQAH